MGMYAAHYDYGERAIPLNMQMRHRCRSAELISVLSLVSAFEKHRHSCQCQQTLRIAMQIID